MKKLIVNTGTLAAGGAERVLSILSKPLADTFDDVHYVMWLDAKHSDIFYEIDPRIKIVRISQASGSTKIWKQMLWFRKYIKREKPNIILSFMVMICFTVTISLVFTGTKQIVAERNDPRFFKKKWLRKIINWSYLLPDIKGILMQTEWNKKFFTNKNLLNKISVIYNPINIDTQFVGAAINAVKEDVIVCVGRLTYQKQHWVLIDAFAKFHQTHSNFKLIIYGEGEMRNRLQQQIEDLGIADSVCLPGRSQDVMMQILSARMFVTVSAYEGMSNALIEAMCVGLPCISTKVSGATELIIDGKNGTLVNVGDIDEIASKMSIIADNQHIATQYAEEAKKIYTNLNSSKIATQWVTYLKNLC